MANAFADTALQETLVASGRQNLIVIGFMTHNCVSSTVRAAREKGYACTVVAPATGRLLGMISTWDAINGLRMSR